METIKWRVVDCDELGFIVDISGCSEVNMPTSTDIDALIITLMIQGTVLL